MNLTGGLHWHARAWRAQSRWAQTRAEIETWLLTQAVPTGHLMVIGASAGWMMSTEWLARFKTVQTWDIDPMSAPLFHWRHGRALKAQGVRLTCHTGDALTQLPILLREHPQATVFLTMCWGKFVSRTLEPIRQKGVCALSRRPCMEDTGAVCTIACRAPF